MIRTMIWNKGSFHVLCHNDRYRGIYMYGDIRIPGGMPRIISDELFYDAQEALQRKDIMDAPPRGREKTLRPASCTNGIAGAIWSGSLARKTGGEMHYYCACQKRGAEHAKKSHPPGCD